MGCHPLFSPPFVWIFGAVGIQPPTLAVALPFVLTVCNYPVLASQEHTHFMHFSRSSRGSKKLALKKASTIAAIRGVCCIDFFIVYKMFINFDNLLNVVYDKFNF